MELSILLPTLGNRIDELKRLFISLENQNNKSFELIIVSQGNHKIIEELLREFTFKYNQIKIEKNRYEPFKQISYKCKGAAKETTAGKSVCGAGVFVLAFAYYILI